MVTNTVPRNEQQVREKAQQQTVQLPFSSVTPYDKRQK